MEPATRSSLGSLKFSKLGHTCVDAAESTLRAMSNVRIHAADAAAILFVRDTSIDAFVAVKSTDQKPRVMLHRTGRDLLIRQRTHQ